jgi:hypothetical protein
MIYTVLAIVVLLLGYVAFFLLYRQNAARRLGTFPPVCCFPTRWRFSECPNGRGQARFC